jgi:hypothetical protein
MRFKSFKINKSNDKPKKETVESGDTTATQVAGIEEKINKKTKNLKKAAQQLKGLSDMSKDFDEDDIPARPHGPLGELRVEPEDRLLDLEAEADISSLLEENDEEVTVIEVNAGVAVPMEADELRDEATATAEADKVSTKADAKADGDKASTEAIFKAEGDEASGEAATKAEAEAEESSAKASAPVEAEKPSAEAAAQAEAKKETKPADDNDSFNNLFSNEEEEVNPLANLINSLPDVTAQELFDDLKEIKEIIMERQKG